MEYSMGQNQTSLCCKLLEVIKIQGEIVAELSNRTAEQENLINMLLRESVSQ